MSSPAATDTRPPTSFQLLGPVTATVAGTAVRLGGPRQVAVLARLLLSPGQVVSMEQLSESLWDGAGPARPEVAIRSYVSNLRRSIEPDRAPGDRRSSIEAVAPGYRLLVAPDRIDAHRYEELVRAARRHLGDGDRTAAVDALDQARALWRGEPGEGVIETDVVLAFRARLTELRQVASELWFETRLALGDHQSVLPDLEAAVAERPRRERLTELVMVALYRDGRQAEALAACHRLRSHLLDQLGIDPGPAVRALEHKILTHDQSLLLPPGADRSGPGEQRRAGPVPRPPVHPRRADGPHRPGPGSGPGGGFGPVTELVGRHRELVIMAGLEADLAQGRGASILVTGEPGAGKSALVTHTADGLACDGVTVVWGRCRAVARDQVLWPWSQVLDGLSDLADGDALDGLTALVSLVPSLGPAPSPGPLSPGSPPGPPRTPAEATVLFPAVTDLLRRLSGRQPVVVVLEDAHWADEASIELVAFAGAALAEAPVGFVVVWRTTEAEPAATRQALRDLARMPAMTRVELTGLPAEAIEELLGPPAPGRAQLARALRQVTGGNPFLVRELTAALIPTASYRERADDDRADGFGGPTRHEAGDRLAVLTTGDRHEVDLVAELLDLAPSTNTQALMAHRVEQSHPSALTALTVGALCPRSFSAEVVAEVTGLALNEVEAALDRAHDAGLLAEDGPVGRRYRFTHPVGARALVAVVPGPRLARLHAALGHALWRHGADPVDLAFHFARARSTGTSLLAARFALDSVGRACRPDVLAQAEALAADALVLLEPLAGTGGLELELATFRAQAARLRGDEGGAWAGAERALAVARLTPDPGLQAVTALAATGSHPTAPLTTPAWVDGDGPGPDWSRAVVADALGAVGAGSPWAEALELRLARLTGRARAGPAIVEPGPASPGAVPRPGLASRGAAVPGRAVPGHAAWAAWRERVVAVLAVGPGPGVPAAPATPEAVHDRLLAARLALVTTGPLAAREALGPEPRGDDADDGPASLEALDRALTAAAVAAVEGRVDGAEAAAGTLARWWVDTAPAVAAAVAEQRLWLRWEQGRFDELDELASAGAPLPWQALAAAVAGRTERARALLDRLHGGPGQAGGPAVPAGAGPAVAAACPTGGAAVSAGAGPAVVAACLTAVAAQRVGHRVAAAAALKQLASGPASVASARAGLIVLGPVAYFAGLAAATLGHRAPAAELLARAGVMADQAGAPPWSVRVLMARAELAATAHDWARAEQLLAEAKSLAADTGIGWLDGRLSRPGLQSSSNPFATR